MELQYYIVDAEDQIRRAGRDAVENLWNGRGAVDALGCTVGVRLRLITVLCDEDLLPVVTYFARFDLQEGRITPESKVEAFEAMTSRHSRRYDNPSAQRQFRGWPTDWQRQLAVALDIPAGQLKRIGIGGPLLMSEIWGIPLDRVIAYFEEAADK